MAGGKARGPSRQYQLERRYVLTCRNPGLAPSSDDGIDVPFGIPAGSYSLLALGSSRGHLS